MVITGSICKFCNASTQHIATRACNRDARIVVNVANLMSTRLAWDVGSALSNVLEFEREIVLDWDQPPDWFTQDYCLVYRPLRTAS